MLKYIILGATALLTLFDVMSVWAQNNELVPVQSKEIQLTDSSKIRVLADQELRIVNRSSRKNPVLASWMSAIVPGSGQVYNNRAWKLPVIYGAFATTIYLTIDYNNRYLQYKDIYLEIDAQETKNQNDLDRAKEGMKYYTRYRDLNAIFTLLIYVLNIVDASVDAHLSDFDIDDNLSHNWQPTLLPADQQLAMGLKYTIRF